MTIRSKITLLVTALMTSVVLLNTANLAVVETSRAKAASGERMYTLMEGVLRIARESLKSHDELMLLSYLKFLMQEYPEIEIVEVGREGHRSVLGEVRTALFYRTITLTEDNAASFRAADVTAPRPAAAVPASNTIPPDTFTIRLGFSKTALDHKIDAIQRELWRTISVIAAVGLLLGFAGSFWVGHLLARPLAEVAAAARRVGEGRLDTQIPVRGDDELADLSGCFNDMAAKMQELVQFKEDLMSTLSHEMRTPLGGLKGFLQYLQSSPAAKSPLEREKAYSTMLEAVNQMELSLTNALMLFRAGARPAISREPVDLSEVAGEVIRLFTPAAQANGVRLTGPRVARPVTVAADRELIRRIVINLIANAVHYTPSGGEVKVALDDGPETVTFAVADTGPGIADGDRRRVFDKFYRADGPDGRPQRIPGSGLGLAIAKQAVDLHQGSIWVESELGKGSKFQVELPKQARPMEASHA